MGGSGLSSRLYILYRAPGIAHAVHTMAEETRWIADEMVGKLARYLRFLGYDVVYAHGMRDGQILELSRNEQRVILTRDELLATRARSLGVLLRSLDVEGQLREVGRAFPSLRKEVQFTRCSLCNGRLVPADRSTPAPPKGVPLDVWTTTREVSVCPLCGHAFWEGTHTEEIRQALLRAFQG